MARINADPTVTYTKQDSESIDEINFPDTLFVEKMSSNYYFAIIDGVSYDIRRTRKGAKWKLTKQ